MREAIFSYANSLVCFKPQDLAEVVCFSLFNSGALIKFFLEEMERFCHWQRLYQEKVGSRLNERLVSDERLVLVEIFMTLYVNISLEI